MRNSTKRPYRFAIILVSIASLFPTFAVLVAGSPSYGLVSGFIGLGRGTKLLGFKAYVIPSLFLAAAAVPVAFVFTLVVLKVGSFVG